MAPHPGVDPDQIKEKARKDLLDLLEGVCKAQHLDPNVLLSTKCCRSEGRKIL